MKVSVKENTTAIIDIKNIMDDYRRNKQLKEFFKFIPIEDIVERVLSVNYYIDYSEPVYDLIDEHLNLLDKEYNDLDIDLDAFTILIESIVEDVDNLIVNTVKIPDEVYYISIATLPGDCVILKFKK